MQIPQLIPSKIRTEGRELFERVKPTLDFYNQDYFEHPEDYGDIKIQLEPDVDSSMASFDLTDFTCTCPDFAKRGFCKHYIALDLYYKSLPEDLQERISAEALQSPSYAAELLSSLPNQWSEEEEQESFIQLHLSAELDIERDRVRCTLKIRPDDADRAYVVKNVGTLVEHTLEGYSYFISKKYDEVPLSLEIFDEPSQRLIQFIDKVFLSRKTEQYSYYFSSSATRDCERYVLFPSVYFAEAFPLLQDLERFEFVTSQANYREVFMDPHPWMPETPLFEVQEVKDHYRIQSLGNFGEVVNEELLVRQNHFYLIPKQYRHFIQQLDNWLKYHQKSYPLDFSLSQKAELVEVCQTLQKFAPVTLPAELEVRDFTPLFSFKKTRNQIRLDMVWDFGNVEVESQEALHQLPFAYDHQKSQKIFAQLRSAGFRDHFSSLSSIKTIDFFLKALPRFRKLGQVELDESLASLYFEDPADIEILDDQGFLSVQFDFSMISDDEIDKALRALWNQESHYQTKQGGVLVFNDESLKVAKSLQDLRARFAHGRYQMHKSRAFTLAETFKDNDAINFSQDFQQLAHDLAHPEEFAVKPYEVKATLRDYQKVGVQWMSMLDHYNFGGILADDMGLGKTLQTISLLKANLEEGRKVLILAPASLLYNWKEEFRKFAPELEVAVAYGSKSAREKIIAQQATVTVTSYQSFRSDVKEYQKYYYDYLILDEAQMVKNSQTKVAQALRDFNVKSCYALSGTPVENRLEEIWSIFQIVLPGLLPSKKEFSKLSPELVAKLIQPFVLRRKKGDVVKELPALSEHLYSNELTTDQKTIYLAQLKRMQDLVAGATSDEIKRHKIEILAGLTRLRQICNTPALFLEDYEGESGKMDSLMELLKTIREKGSRPLIFSQFTSMLELIEQELDKQGISYFKITGQTPSDQRQDMVTAFNQGNKDCFLISLKAGGTGLNLTGADTVILCDLWWNPAVEMQAIGRSHRIGQTKQVEVYRLITLGTIEEKIQELQESKKELFNTVMDGQESKANLSVEDIREILGVE